MGDNPRHNQRRDKIHPHDRNRFENENFYRSGNAQLRGADQEIRPVCRGVNLNLNFPSVVGTVNVGERKLEYGYSSGIYTKYVSTTTPIKSAPTQDEIDQLGGGKTIRNWEARFDLAYEKCKGQNVTLVGGVAPTTLDFARYLNQTYKVYPKDIWKIQIMTLGSVPGINTRLSDALQAMYGDVTIREIYGAPKACLASKWMKNVPGHQTMTCSFLKFKPDQA